MDVNSGLELISPPTKDGIKLYDRNKWGIDSLIQLTRINSNNIGISFRMNTFGLMFAKSGKVIWTEGVEMPEGRTADTHVSYMYLGIPQANRNHDKDAWRLPKVKYLQKVRLALISQLNHRNKIKAYHTNFPPVIIYPVGIISWPHEWIDATDVKTWQLLTVDGCLHLRSITLWFYEQQKDGKKALVSVRGTMLD